MASGMAHKSIKLFLANLKSRPPLIVKAQWNPAEIKESRSTKWNDIEIGGYVAPISIYAGGGNRVISFQLLFDATEQSRSFDVFRVDTPLTGIVPTIESLKSFTYPQSDSIFKFNEKSIYGEPPICYLGIGLRVMRGRMRGFNITYELFNRLLVPVRARADVEFIVEEIGIWAQVESAYRRIASVINPVIGGL